MPPSATRFINAPIYTLSVPQETPWHPEQALHFMETLLGSFPSFALRIKAMYHGIVWQIIDLSGATTHIDPAVLKAHYSGLVVELSFLKSSKLTQPFSYADNQYKLHTFSNRPILFVTEMTRMDVLVSVVQAMSYLQNGEAIIYTIVIARNYKPTAHQWLDVANKIVRTSKPNQFRFPSSRELVNESKIEARWYECFFSCPLPHPM